MGIYNSAIRCSACQAVTPLAIVWAAGDVCPRCAAPLAVARGQRSGRAANGRPQRAATATDRSRPAYGRP
jgi:predicted amidophosphoribosyltransferase